MNILVIEDNTGDYYLIEDYLLEKSTDLQLTHSLNFTDARELLAGSNTYSLIFLDLHLPELSGLDLASAITSLRPGTPVIVLTGYADLEVARSCLSMGVADFLIKDEINPEILYKSVLYAMDRDRFVKKLERARLDYEHVFNLSPQPMWICAYPSLQIIKANHAAMLRFGYSNAEFQQIMLHDLLPDTVDSSSIRTFSETREAGKPYALGVHHLITHSGEGLNVELYSNDLIYQDVNARIFLANDITEKLYHQQTIEAQNTKLKNIAWTQSHIVRAPLSRILGIINLLEIQSQDPDELANWLEQIRASALEMDQIVRNIVEQTKGLDIKSSL